MHGRTRPLLGAVVAALALFGLPVVTPSAATAAQPVPGHTRLVPEKPRADQPKISTGDIFDIEVVGNRVFVAGSFTSITNPGGGAVAQPLLAAYDYTTGRVDTAFRPTFDAGAELAAIEASPDGASLYVAGTFNTVNGVTKRKVARLDPATGAPVAQFTANANARATSLAVSPTTVYVGGQFASVNSVARAGLAAVNAQTGAVDSGFNLPITGGLGVGGMLTVPQLKLTHDDKSLLVVHTGRQVAGQDRYGVALVDTAAKALRPWRTRLWQDNLVLVGGVQRIVAGDIAPDDTYFVVTSGSGGDRPPINDTAVAFPISGGDGVEPLWVSRHFDSVYSVAITERAVYVGGHFQWQESATSPVPWPGLDEVGYGTGQGLSGYGLGDAVVRRDHLGALDPATGTALEWDPGSNSARGVMALEATARGLFAGGDGKVQGGLPVGRIGFYDLAQTPAPTAVDTTITSPVKGRVVPGGTTFTADGQATSSNGVTKVQVEVYDRSLKRYLQDDGVTWGTANSLLATLGSPGAIRSQWSLRLSLPTGAYELRAKAFGRNATSDPVKATNKFEAFSNSDPTPATSISAPASGLLTTTSLQASGTASDDRGVVRLSAWLRTSGGLYLQEDGTLAPEYHTFSFPPASPGATVTTWAYAVELPAQGEWRMYVSAIDTSGQADSRGAARDWTVNTTGQAPVVSVTSPAAMTPPTAAAPVSVTPGTSVTFAGNASDESRLRSVEVYLANTTTGEALFADGTWGWNPSPAYHKVTQPNLDVATVAWSYTSRPLSPGVYTFRVRATDNDGIVTTSANRGQLTVNAQVPDDAFPDGQLSFVGTDQNIEQLHLDLTGSATDDKGVSAVRVMLHDLDTGRYLQPDGTMSGTFATLQATLAGPGATSTTFALSVDLPTKGQYSVKAWAVDTSGQQDVSVATATAQYLVYPGDADPVLDPVLASPVDGAVFDDGRIIASGRANDDNAMGRVDVQIRNAAGQYMTASGTFSATAVWIAAFLTSPGTPGSNYAYSSPTVPAGSYTLSVRAVDHYGQVQQVPRVVTVTVR